MRERTLKAALAALLGSVGWGGLPAAAQPPPGISPAGEIFRDEAAASGLDFVHFNGMSGELYFLENMGSGAALLDYDGDGDLDAYLVQGHMLGPGKTLAEATFPPPAGRPLTDRLYRQDEIPDADDGLAFRFVDVTESSGIDASGYGMGVAVADFDNDGWLDLYLTNYGSNQAWRNRGDGTFEEIADAAGADDVRWSVPASFFDLDRDGWLDLYVGNYVRYNFSLTVVCTTQTGAPDYCGPLAYPPEGDRLFRNRGDGTFEDLTRQAGLSSESGGALGAVATDFDGDGWTDLYVANDMMPNQLWINGGDGTFSNEALFAGCAVNWEGKPEASMGVDAADIDGDGDEDLFMAHLAGETNTLYLNDGRGIFRDRTQASGLGNPSWPYTGFGAAWFDYDSDGLLDLLTVNGAVKQIEELVLAGDVYPLHQPNLLFRNLGDGSFEDVTRAAGAVFELSEVSRGAAFGDVDNDGDTDVLVSNNAGPARLLINRAGQESAWIGVRLTDARGEVDALGSRAAVTDARGRTLWRRVRADGSYASSQDPRIRVGLGAGGEPAQVRVEWPDGHARIWQGLPAGVYTVARRGSSPR